MGFQIILRRVFGIKKCLKSIKTLFRDTENRLRLHIKYVVWTCEFKLNLDFWVATGDFSSSTFSAWLKSHDSKFANPQMLFPKPAVFTYHDGHSNFQEKLYRKFPEFRSRKRNFSVFNNRFLWWYFVISHLSGTMFTDFDSLIFGLLKGLPCFPC